MFTLLFLCACATYLLLNLQLVRGLNRVGKSNAAARQLNTDADQPLITILVAARDEEVKLPRTLDALLAQDWPAERTQIVIVDDRSADATPDLLKTYAAQYPGRVESVRVETSLPGVSPKKNALAQGLKIARGSWIAVTDADCTMGPGWLRALAAQFGTDDEKVGMVFGVTAYKESLLGFTPAEGARALEFISYGVANAGLAGHGFPVSANANNLAYRRAAFEQAGGFAAHRSLVSGDDDFTLQGIHAAGWDFRFCATPAALVRTTGPDTWSEFWEQRKRWAGKCIHYRPPQVAFLTGIYLFYTAIAVLLLAGLFRIGDESWGLLGLIGLASKALGELASMRAGLNLFGLGPLLRFFPLTSALHLPLVLASVPVGTLGSFMWKGQKMGRKA